MKPTRLFFFLTENTFKSALSLLARDDTRAAVRENTRRSPVKMEDHHSRRDAQTFEPARGGGSGGGSGVPFSAARLQEVETRDDEDAAHKTPPRGKKRFEQEEGGGGGGGGGELWGDGWFAAAASVDAETSPSARKRPREHAAAATLTWGGGEKRSNLDSRDDLEQGAELLQLLSQGGMQSGPGSNPRKNHDEEPKNQKARERKKVPQGNSLKPGRYVFGGGGGYGDGKVGGSVSPDESLPYALSAVARAPRTGGSTFAPERGGRRRRIGGFAGFRYSPDDEEGEFIADDEQEEPGMVGEGGFALAAAAEAAAHAAAKASPPPRPKGIRSSAPPPQQRYQKARKAQRSTTSKKPTQQQPPHPPHPPPPSQKQPRKRSIASRQPALTEAGADAGAAAASVLAEEPPKKKRRPPVKIEPRPEEDASMAGKREGQLLKAKTTQFTCYAGSIPYSFARHVFTGVKTSPVHDRHTTWLVQWWREMKRG